MAEAQDDRDVVRREYADETGLSARIAIWARRTGPRAIDVAFDEVLACSPRRVLEVGCGRGELAERLVQAGLEVVALDQSERMVELTGARGVDARVGDVQALPFADGEFDVAVANFMLYHVPDVDRALAELSRARSSRRRTASTSCARCGSSSAAISATGGTYSCAKPAPCSSNATSATCA